MKCRTLKWHLILMLTALVLGPGSAPAQNGLASPSLKRIGIVAAFGCPLSPNAPDYTVRRRLAELGWIEGKNFIFDCVLLPGGRLEQAEQLATEIVARHPDVISAQAVPVVRALKRATTTIPIVMYATADPVGAGLVTNLARPEANVTGIAWFGFDILPKRVEILKEAMPQMQRLAIIFTSNADPKVLELLEANANIAAKQFGLSFEIFRPAVRADYEEIFSQLLDKHFDAAYIAPNPLAQQNYLHIVEVALRHRVPTMGDDVLSARVGLLFGYGQDFATAMTRHAEYIDKILRGAKPSDLPVEQATKVQLGINLKTARTIGLTVPPGLLTRADEVVE